MSRAQRIGIHRIINIHTFLGKEATIRCAGVILAGDGGVKVGKGVAVLYRAVGAEGQLRAQFFQTGEGIGGGRQRLAAPGKHGVHIII